MKAYTKDELAKILKDHNDWLNTRWNVKPDGSRADLRGAVLRGAVLRDADLTGAILRGADLTRADLTGAALTGAILTGAILTGADLTRADLTGAILRDADLTGAILRGADLTRAALTGAILTGAILRGADLTRADLTGAALTGAILTGAILRGADLTRADLRGAVLRDGYTRWEQYVKEVVPALCVAGGKSLDDVANPEFWACHEWGSDDKPLGCPMAKAFGVHTLGSIPPLYRQLANDFIQFFDAGLIPLGEVNPKYASASAASCAVDGVKP